MGRCGDILAIIEMTDFSRWRPPGFYYGTRKNYPTNSRQEIGSFLFVDFHTILKQRQKNRSQKKQKNSQWSK